MKFWPAVIAGYLVLGFIPGARSQEAADRSLSDKSEVEKLEARVKVLEENLILAKAESEYFRDKWQELRLRNEALGLEALTDDEQALQEKLVRVVGELYQSEKSRRLLEAAAKELMQAGVNMLKAGPGTPAFLAQKRADYEVALRSLGEVLDGRGGRLPAAADLKSGQIVSVDQKLGLAVLNFRKAQGVRIGMPFRVLRGENIIGKCKVIEVRDSVSAALIETTKKQTELQAGDRLLLETTN
jgi:hypothetical protein